MKNYCQERNGRRYFRMRVPQALHSQLGTEITQPIHTLDLQTAYRRCRLLGARLQQVFDQALSGIISMSILHPYIRELCANILYMDESRMWSGNSSADYYEALQTRYEEAYRSKTTDEAESLIRLLENQGFDVDPDAPDVHVLRCPVCGRRLQVPCVSRCAQSSGLLPSRPKALFRARWL